MKFDLKHSNNKLTYWIALGVLGVFIIIAQNLFKEILFRVIGIGLMAVSALGVVNWFRYKDRTPDGLIRLAGGALFFLLGLWITVNPMRFDRLVNVVIGLVPVVVGIQWFMRGWKPVRSYPILASAVLAVIVGLVIMCNSAATTWVIVLGGIGLVYTAVIGIVGEMKYQR